jgi:hypothetical protein
MAPANFGMICIHNFTAILLIFAYFFEGLRGEVEVRIASFLPVIVLVIIYLPIASLIWRRLSSQKRIVIQT